MALPKAAQKQLKAAEELHAAAYAEEATPEAQNDDTPADPIADDAGESTPPAAEGGGTLSEVQGAEGGDAPPAEGPKEGTVDFWKHKYDVLQGKYNAEVPRLQQQNDGLTGRINDLEAQMANFATQIAEPGETITPSTLLTDEEREDYGDDMIAVVKKAAREEFEPMIATLQQENGQLRALLGGMQEQTVQSARDTMLSTLDTEQANWRELNQNPEFLGWLENVDPYNGMKRLDMLRQAFEGNNTTRVLAFFKGFLNENAAYAPTPTPSPAAEPQVNLDTLVAPGRATEGGEARAQEGAPQGRTWSGAEIKQFYADVNRGVYRNNPEEQARLENDLFLAQPQGRIVP